MPLPERRDPFGVVGPSRPLPVIDGPLRPGEVGVADPPNPEPAADGPSSVPSLFAPTTVEPHPSSSRDKQQGNTKRLGRTIRTALRPNADTLNPSRMSILPVQERTQTHPHRPVNG